jgi:hypothetical protein
MRTCSWKTHRGQHKDLGRLLSWIITFSVGRSQHRRSLLSFTVTIHSFRAFCVQLNASNMRSFVLFSAALVGSVAATIVAVNGAAEGFAKGIAGGGSSTAVYPDTIDELVSYLGDDEARVIVLTNT